MNFTTIPAHDREPRDDRMSAADSNGLTTSNN
jgi:hypothetical protein